jgi:hypothetical protein
MFSRLKLELEVREVDVSGRHLHREPLISDMAWVLVRK